jgi:hypothetical protein
MPAWSVKGRVIYACPCEVSCDCDFGSPPTAGFCTVIIGRHIESGRYGDVVLDGLNVAAVIHSPGHMANGNFKFAAYLDERANVAQREALAAIFSTKPGSHYGSMAKAIAQDLGVRYVPITVETEGRRWKVSIDGIANADITAIEGLNGKDVVIENDPEEQGPVMIGRSAHTTYQDYDIRLDVSGKNAAATTFAFSST